MQKDVPAEGRSTKRGARVRAETSWQRVGSTSTSLARHRTSANVWCVPGGQQHIAKPLSLPQGRHVGKGRAREADTPPSRTPNRTRGRCPPCPSCASNYSEWRRSSARRCGSRCQVPRAALVFNALHLGGIGSRGPGQVLDGGRCKAAQETRGRSALIDLGVLRVQGNQPVWL